MSSLEAIDVLVLLKILARAGGGWTQPEVAHELRISQSMVSRALKSAAAVSLYHPKSRLVNAEGLAEGLIHGARYFLAPERGGEVRGMPTAWAGPPLNQLMVSDSGLPPVWPDPEGEVRGLLVQPLHPNVPQAARQDAPLYELLSLVDALRIGSTRDRSLAAQQLRQRIHPS